MNASFLELPHLVNITNLIACIFNRTCFILDIIWYHNDKIIRNTENVKIRIEKNKTSCTIKNASNENVGVYVCKAVSDIGLAVTKAKLYVKEITEAKKKEKLELKVAEEIEEKVKKERVKVEKKVQRKVKQTKITTTDFEKPVEVEEIRPQESTEQITEVLDEKQQAKPVLQILSPLQTEAIASCKKIDDAEEEIQQLETAKELVSPVEPLYIEESISEHITESFGQKKPKSRRAKPETTPGVSETATIAEVKLEEIIVRVEEIIAKEEIKMAKEITEILETVRAKEFGPGEYPLREIAEIGYLIRNGITIKEVSVLYSEDKFPALKTPEAQSALVNVVERKGYGPLISEVLTEETVVDEKLMAATVGFRAFMKMIELKHATIEEVITQFVPEDFVQHAWEATETQEVNKIHIFSKFRERGNQSDYVRK